MAFHVYLLSCSSRSYYIGHTDNPEGRIAQHQSGALGGYVDTATGGVAERRVISDPRGSAGSGNVVEGIKSGEKEAWVEGDFALLKRWAKMDFSR
jgi:hypothetical protein